jgi:hypothetical protein
LAVANARRIAFGGQVTMLKSMIVLPRAPCSKILRRENAPLAGLRTSASPAPGSFISLCHRPNANGSHRIAGSKPWRRFSLTHRRRGPSSTQRWRSAV